MLRKSVVWVTVFEICDSGVPKVAGMSAVLAKLQQFWLK
jgi:hypothetical protein